MLRWCQSTLRTLDGYGRNTSIKRRLPSGVAALASSTISSRTYSEGIYAMFSRKALAQAIDKLSALGGPPHTSGSPIRQEIAASNAPKNSHDARSLSVSHSPINHSRSPSISHPPTNTHIAAIEQLLSPSPSGKKPSIRTLVSLYDDASKQSTIRLLGPAWFTIILRICGTLASKVPSKIYDSPLAMRFEAGLSKTELWSFVVRVGADKAEAGYRLTSKDCYWIMQASLAKARVAVDGNFKLDLDTLRRQYEQLEKICDHPSVHFTYLDILMSSNNVVETVRCLCSYLTRVSRPDPRFAELLWDIILLHGSTLPIASKELICRTAFSRINMNSDYWEMASVNALAVPSLTSDVVRKGIIGIPYMSAAFAGSLSLCYHHQYRSPILSNWAVHHALRALSPELAIDIRWTNITLLAAAISSKDRPVIYQSSPTTSSDTWNSPWRIVLILESMDRTLPRTGSDFGPLCAKVQEITRPLWKAYLKADKSKQHVNISRAFISIFLQIAAKSYDEKLKGQCYHYCRQSGLLTYREDEALPTKAQAFDAIAGYAKAHIACEGRDWTGCFSSISTLLPGLAWQEDVASILIRWYLEENVETAYDLYVHCLEIGVGISKGIVNNLFAGLVKHQRWDIVTLFLKHSSTTQDQLHFIFGESLRVFQIERYRYVDPAYVKLLIQTALKLYEHQRPPPPLKYPIRYFLSILIWTHHVPEMIKFVGLLHGSVPRFFTPRLVHNLALLLVRQRELSNALNLFRIFEGAGSKSVSPSLERIRHKLMFKFFKMGARKVARLVMRGKNRVVSLTNREALAHAGLSMLPSPLLYHKHVQRVAFKAKNDGPAVREAVSLLVKAKRSFTARKLYAKCLTLDAKTHTAIGNIIVHGPILGSGFRNARLVRRVVKIKDLLVNEYNFVPDRTTLNIILKAILGWKTMLDATKVRRLFDNMAHAGYPIPEQFRREYGVPFSSPRGSFKALSMTSLAPGFSFSKHIRPMYKMFIKAFYVRNDVTAAKTVVGILKEVEIMAMREVEKRSKARREGIVKKNLKLKKSKTLGSARMGRKSI